jgi:hypothetical protein
VLEGSLWSLYACCVTSAPPVKQQQEQPLFCSFQPAVQRIKSNQRSFLPACRRVMSEGREEEVLSWLRQLEDDAGESW